METQPLLSTAVQAEAMRKHRRQSFWRILFPVILVSLIVIALVVLAMVTTAGAGNDLDTHWANISLIWVLLPTILGSLVWLAILGGLIFAMVKLLGALPNGFAIVQHALMRVSEVARDVSDKVSAPVIKTKGFWAGVHRLKDRLVGRKT
ncbi:MAG TPA: hypothetical protein VIO36_08835 [Anaerolineaceae bacterium]